MHATCVTGYQALYSPEPNRIAHSSHMGCYTGISNSLRRDNFVSTQVLFKGKPCIRPRILSDIVLLNLVAGYNRMHCDSFAIPTNCDIVHTPIISDYVERGTITPSVEPILSQRIIIFLRNEFRICFCKIINFI